ncbi:nuclear inhibitor of protein phosphatase 1-like isoform X1 [Gadus morhua]|uniref:Nuclear inhibitor of protein phosphatase 1 n=1 Tax=Gadus morhua TaxID=8049 RepID=A0A8C5BZ78_GADMO|nr:nuclear inhibitor of protein phosphatase 1-like isoform X1 [Gadus morhua]
MNNSSQSTLVCSLFKHNRHMFMNGLQSPRSCRVGLPRFPRIPRESIRGRSKMAADTSTNTPPFECPTWAGKPPPGLHLDVVKGDKLVEKLIIDEKKFYLFGRNPDLCDFTTDHQSCSRVHSALVYHRHLKRVFLIDLNSTHGTFLGQIRLEPHKPQQVPIDTTVSFGASTRAYTLREKPQSQPGSGLGTEAKAGGGKGEEEEQQQEEVLKGLLGLPQEETELENLTEFNTAHNKRISTLSIEEGNRDVPRPKRRRRSSRVSFSEDDEVINPEDVDPSVGRFRNMIQTAVVPIKKRKLSDPVEPPGSEDAVGHRTRPFSPRAAGGLYGDLPPTSNEALNPAALALGGPTVLGSVPNLAPEVDLSPVSARPPIRRDTAAPASVPTHTPGPYAAEAFNEPRKKKYAKEAWPGKKPTPSLLI